MPSPHRLGFDSQTVRAACECVMHEQHNLRMFPGRLGASKLSLAFLYVGEREEEPIGAQSSEDNEAPC